MIQATLKFYCVKRDYLEDTKYVQSMPKNDPIYALATTDPRYTYIHIPFFKDKIPIIISANTLYMER